MKAADGPWLIAHQRCGPDPVPTPLCTGDYGGQPVLLPHEVPAHTEVHVNAHAHAGAAPDWPGVPSVASAPGPSGPWTFHNYTNSSLPMRGGWGTGNWNPTFLFLNASNNVTDTSRGSRSTPVLLL